MLRTGPGKRETQRQETSHGGPGVTFIPGYNAGYEVLEAADRDPGRVVTP